jgi:arginine utilization regulatory protein
MSIKWPFESFPREIAGTLFDLHHEGILMIDNQGRMVYYNKSMETLDGLSANDVMGLHILELYNLKAEDCISIRCLTSRKPIINAALYYRATHGKLVNAFCNAYPVYENGEIRGVVCYTAEYTSMADKLEMTERNYARSPHSKKKPLSVDKLLGNGTRHTLASLIGESVGFQAALETAKVAARTPSSVMIFGDTGSGKELFAQAIHNHSLRRSKPFCPINCAAIPENLLEGILFGTVKGAFTGALDREGLFEASSGGTIFLDEIHAMPTGLQAKLLRVIQEKKIRRVGSIAEKPLDLKIISSINRRPEQAVKDGLLRPDLFYRLGVVLLNVPPLRQRSGDIDLLVDHFVKKYNRALNGRVEYVEPEFLSIMRNYDWPGNVRELEHVVETALNFAVNDPLNDRSMGLRHIQPAHLRKFLRKSAMERRKEDNTLKDEEPDTANPVRTIPPDGQSDESSAASNAKARPLLSELRLAEKRSIAEALRSARGNMAEAARSLGLSRQNMFYKVKKYNLKDSPLN